MGSDPGCGPAHCSSSYAVAATHMQNTGRLAQIGSGTILLKQKEENWQQMLARGQSSSPKSKKQNKPASHACWKIPRRKQICGHAWNVSQCPVSVRGGDYVRGDAVESEKNRHFYQSPHE